jgi:uncharacterized protein (UPF0128 family)
MSEISLYEIKQIQELLEDTHAHLEIDEFGISFNRYFGDVSDKESLYKYKHIIPLETLDAVSLSEIVEHLLYESDYLYDQHKNSWVKGVTQL